MMLRLSAATLALALIAAPAAAQDYTLDPTFGWLNLMTGYVPDPAVIPLIAGGDIDAASLGQACVGFIANAPDFRVNYEAGTDYPLIISAMADADTTLVVNDAAGNWHCNDDTEGFNPVVRIDAPTSGQYDIWVGVYGEAATAPAGLYISEVMTAGETMGGYEDDHAH